MRNKILLVFSAFIILFCSCSNKKNTATTRWYHSVNTKYNIHFNAEQAYADALKSKITGKEETFSELLPIYHGIDVEENKKELGGPFDIVIDKATKAIKLHSIQVKPERDPGKSRNKKYQDWLKQREFNPFLKNSWLIMGKAEYQNDDYLKAASTFSYISRLYRTDEEIVSEARLWMALCYTQMEWYYEADNIFYQIELAGGVPKKNQKLFSGIYANYLVRNKEYEKSIPYLQTAIKSESGLQKTRLKYLLAQVYAHLGKKAEAYKSFGSVPGMSTPYLYTFNSKIAQVEHANPKDLPKMESMLKRMARNSKNKEYLDQVYLALGNIYLNNNNDTVKAIESYKKGVEGSTRNGYDKAMCQIQLGDIYFVQKEYSKAAPCYTEAASQLTKSHDAYPRVSLRADVLGEVVIHSEAIHLQDSLQYLARLPEAERLGVINKLIADLKKAEEQERKLAEREANMEQGGSVFENNQIAPPTMPGMGGANASSFYFYNPQAVSQGKVVFQQRWGNRKLEDNWRRRDKTENTFGNDFLTESQPQDESVQVSDSIGGEQVETPEAVLDKYSPDYYLQQIPMTPEAIAASNVIIEDALFNLGGIYKDKLEDFDLAIDAYQTDINRFPSTPNLEEIYYQLFLIYSRMGNKSMADVYKNKLIAEFAKGDYAVTLSDPNYEWNLKNMGKLQNTLYEKTYESYLAGNVSDVRKEVQSVRSKYPVSPLMPKFLFLNALTYARTNESGKFKEELQFVVDNYPNSDVTPMASGILKELQSGRPLAIGGDLARGMVWDVRFGDPMAEVDSLMRFNDNREDNAQVLLLYMPNTLDRNQLIYDIADYNFSNFTLRTFDLNFSQLGPFEMLEIGGMDSYGEMKEYVDKALNDKKFTSRLDSNIIIVPISKGNYDVLLRGRSLGEYFSFLDETYKNELSRISSRWKAYSDQETKSQSEDPVDDKNELEDRESEEIKDIELTNEDSEKKDIFKENEHKAEKSTKKEENIGTVSSDSIPQRVEVGVEDILTDKEIEIADEVINTANKILSNPVDGIKSLFEKQNDKPKLTKEEKAEIKAEKEEQKRLRKEEKAKQKAVQDSIKNVEKEKERLRKEEEKAEREAKELIIKQKKDAEKAAAKAKKDALRQKAEERKAKEKARKEALKQKERERNEKLKQKERERNEKLKQRKRSTRRTERE